MTLLILNLQGRLSLCDRSQMKPDSVSNTPPPHLGHLPIGSWPVKSIFATGSFGASDFAARPFPFAGRGSNSKLTLPSFAARKALKGRPFFEMNLSSKSV